MKEIKNTEGIRVLKRLDLSNEKHRLDLKMEFLNLMESWESSSYTLEELLHAYHVTELNTHHTTLKRYFLVQDEDKIHLLYRIAE